MSVPLNAFKKIIRSSGEGCEGCFSSTSSTWMNRNIDEHDTTATIELRSLAAASCDPFSTNLAITITPATPGRHFPTAAILSVASAPPPSARSSSASEADIVLACRDVVIKEWKLSALHRESMTTTVSMKTITNIAMVIGNASSPSVVDAQSQYQRLYVTLRLVGCCDMSNEHRIGSVRLEYLSFEDLMREPSPAALPSSVTGLPPQPKNGQRSSLSQMMEDVLVVDSSSRFVPSPQQQLPPPSQPNHPQRQRQTVRNAAGRPVVTISADDASGDGPFDEEEEEVGRTPPPQRRGTMNGGSHHGGGNRRPLPTSHNDSVELEVHVELTPPPSTGGNATAAAAAAGRTSSSLAMMNHSAVHHSSVSTVRPSSQHSAMMEDDSLLGLGDDYRRSRSPRQPSMLRLYGNEVDSGGAAPPLSYMAPQRHPATSGAAPDAPHSSSALSMQRQARTRTKIRDDDEPREGGPFSLQSSYRATDREREYGGTDSAEDDGPTVIDICASPMVVRPIDQPPRHHHHHQQRQRRSEDEDDDDEVQVMAVSPLVGARGQPSFPTSSSTQSAKRYPLSHHDDGAFHANEGETMVFLTPHHPQKHQPSTTSGLPQDEHVHSSSLSSSPLEVELEDPEPRRYMEVAGTPPPPPPQPFPTFGALRQASAPQVGPSQHAMMKLVSSTVYRDEDEEVRHWDGSAQQHASHFPPMEVRELHNTPKNDVTTAPQTGAATNTFVENPQAPQRSAPFTPQEYRTTVPLPPPPPQPAANTATTSSRMPDVVLAMSERSASVQSELQALLSSPSALPTPSTTFTQLTLASASAPAAEPRTVADAPPPQQWVAAPALAYEEHHRPLPVGVGQPIPDRRSFTSVSRLRDFQSLRAQDPLRLHDTDDEDEEQVGMLGMKAAAVYRARAAPKIWSESEVEAARTAVSTLQAVPEYDEKQDLVMLVSGALGIQPEALTLSRPGSRQASRASSVDSRSESVASLPTTTRGSRNNGEGTTQTSLSSSTQPQRFVVQPQQPSSTTTTPRSQSPAAAAAASNANSREPSPSVTRNLHSASSGHRSGSFVQLATQPTTNTKTEGHASTFLPFKGFKNVSSATALHWDVYGESAPLSPREDDPFVHQPNPYSPYPEPTVEHQQQQREEEEQLHLVPLRSQLQQRGESVGSSITMTTMGRWTGLNQSLPWYDRSRGNRSMTPTASLSTSFEHHPLAGTLPDSTAPPQQQVASSFTVQSQAWSATRLAGSGGLHHSSSSSSTLPPRGILKDNDVNALTMPTTSKPPTAPPSANNALPPQAQHYHPHQQQPRQPFGASESTADTSVVGRPSTPMVWSAWCDKHHSSRNGTGRRQLLLAVNPMQGGLWLTMRKTDGTAWRGPTEAILTPQAIPPAHQLPRELQGKRDDNGDLRQHRAAAENTIALEAGANVRLLFGMDAYRSGSIHMNRVKVPAHCVVLLRSDRLITSLEFDNMEDVRTLVLMIQRHVLRADLHAQQQQQRSQSRRASGNRAEDGAHLSQQEERLMQMQLEA